MMRVASHAGGRLRPGSSLAPGRSRRGGWTLLALWALVGAPAAEEGNVGDGVGTSAARAAPAVIADVAADGLASRLGGRWRVVTDQVMGGVSAGELALVELDGRPCVRLTGDVRLERNGGFLQLALDLERDGRALDASAYEGVRLLARGNGEVYGVHLRTSDLWFPWQSYRAGFVAGSAWSEVRLPFADFQPYRTGMSLEPARLIRLGVFAIGRVFQADVCVAEVGLYR